MSRSTAAPATETPMIWTVVMTLGPGVERVLAATCSLSAPSFPARRTMAGCLIPTSSPPHSPNWGSPSYRARQIYEALTRGLVTDFAAVTTLPLPLAGAAGRAALTALADGGGDARRGSRDGAQDAVPDRRRPPGRGRPDADGRPGHRLRLHPGRLRRRLRVLRVRAAWGCAGTSRRRRWSTRCSTSRACSATRGTTPRDQRRLHGHGRAVPQLRPDPARLPPAQRPQGVRAGGARRSRSPPSESCRASTGSPRSRCSSTWR